MNFKTKIVLVGILGLSIIYTCLAISIALSPWFSWLRNALSDLGHSVKSNVAAIFNLGLVLGGFLIAQYAILLLLKVRRMFTYYFLAFSGFCLQLIGVFDEVYGVIHFIVSLTFFLTIMIATAFYVFEGRSKVASISLLVEVGSWFVYFLSFLKIGIAVPELISVVAATIWITKDMYSIVRSLWF